MTCSDRSRTHGIRTSALNYNGLNTLLIRVASFVFAQPSRIVTRIAATGLFALGALAASAMLPVDEARAQSATLTGGDTCTGDNCTIQSDGTATFTLAIDSLNLSSNADLVEFDISFAGSHANIDTNFMLTTQLRNINSSPSVLTGNNVTYPDGANTGDIGIRVQEALNFFTNVVPVDGSLGLSKQSDTLDADFPGGSRGITLVLTAKSAAAVGETISVQITMIQTSIAGVGGRIIGNPISTNTLVYTVATPPVVDLMPTFGTQTIAAQRYTRNEGIGTITLPTATGGDGSLTYSLTPNTLPPGIFVSSDASMPLVLTGTPTEISPSAAYTYTATDSDGANPDSVSLMFNITITEFAVEPEEVKAEVETVATLVGAVQTGLTAGLVRSRFSVQPSSGVAGRDTPDANGATGGATTSLTLPDNPRDLADILGGLALEHTADADSGGQYAVWLRGQYTSMDGDPTLNGITVNYDGNSSGLGIGAEKSTGRYVAGVAVNWLTTDLDISSSSTSTTISNYEESLVMVAPYLSLRRGGRTFWFSGGYGIGETDATLEEGEGKASADVEVSFASAGADFVLSENGKNRIIGGLSVLGTRKVVDPLNFAAADVVIPKITLNTFRAQGEITYSRTIEAGAGRVVRPYIGVATLHDAGDRVNDDSHAMDLRGGVDFDGARFDVSLEASTELLREDHESWSVSGSARYQFDPGGRGASLALDGIGGEASDIGLEGGYGMMMRQVHRDALLTPFAGIRHGSESGEFSSGMRLAVGGDMDADLRAARAFGNDEDTLKLNFRRTF